jgi:hypothetical protein
MRRFICVCLMLRWCLQAFAVDAYACVPTRMDGAHMVGGGHFVWRLGLGLDLRHVCVWQPFASSARDAWCHQRIQRSNE